MKKLLIVIIITFSLVGVLFYNLNKDYFIQSKKTPEVITTDEIKEKIEFVEEEVIQADEIDAESKIENSKEEEIEDSTNENKHESDKSFENNKYVETKKEITESKQENNVITKPENKTEIIEEKRPWDDLGITEDEYHYSPMWSWQNITYGIYKNYSYKCNSKTDCFNQCVSYGEKMLENNDGSYTCNEVVSYSGKYLGEQFIFKRLEP